MEGEGSWEETAIEELAHARGIENEYLDNWGRVRRTSLSTKKHLLKAMGVISGTHRSDLAAALADQRRGSCRAGTKHMQVVSRSDLPEKLVFCLSRNTSLGPSPRATLRITYENGSQDRITYGPDSLKCTNPLVAGKSPLNSEWEIPFPEIDQLGYHSLLLSVEGGGDKVCQRISLIVCPDKAYLPPDLQGDGRLAGISLSLYAIRSKRNWGVGDFTDLKAIIDWASKTLRADIIGLNPLHAGFNRSPFNTSPYLPISKFYRNFIYLDVEGLEDYQGSDAARALVNGVEIQRQLSELRNSKKVQYEAVAGLKSRVLKIVFQDFLHREGNRTERDALRWNAFQDYIHKEGPFLDRFALFCALDRAMHEKDPNVWTWPQWPKQYQDPGTEAVEEFKQTHREEILFFKYVQWQLNEQLAKVQNHAVKQGMSLGLYHDLALAIDRSAADAWAYQDYFHSRLRVGAPPDAFAQQGQDWGFPPPNMKKIAEDGYAFFIREIRKNSRFGGALRIDHVMRLFHLYCIPEGSPPSDGAYMSQPYTDLLKILALESIRNQVVIIGEDLGTVPDYIRKELTDTNILSYRLLYFEKDGEQNFIEPGDYPSLALVTISTHDLPTLAGFWSCKDIELREKLGMFENPEAVRHASEERGADKRKLLELARKHRMDCCHPEGHVCDEITGDVHNALVGLLAITPCKLLVLSQEDLFKEKRQQNVPGTTSGYPNWSIKMKYTVEELDSDRKAIDYARMFRGWVEKSGRDRNGE